MKESSLISYLVDFCKWFVTIGLVIVLLILALPIFTPYRLMVVLSGSMAPTLLAGDAVLVRPAITSIHEGDIITFQREGELVTHRVVEVQPGQLVTQGDANNAPDPWPVPISAVEGVYALRLPFLGYLVWFARQPIGWVSLVILPAAVLVIGEVTTLVKMWNSKAHSEGS
jgi:signal peptidase